MIGLDTCVLARYFVQDDSRQTRLATGVIESFTHTRRGFVPLAALVELIWVLKKRYAFTRERLGAVLVKFVASKRLAVESAVTVCRAVLLFVTTALDFGDCVILTSCKRAGCGVTYTFDKVASRVRGFRLVPEC